MDLRMIRHDILFKQLTQFVNMPTCLQMSSLGKRRAQALIG